MLQDERVVRQVDAEKLERAHRLLLEYPDLVADRQEKECRLVESLRDELERWHREHTGWFIYWGELGGVIRLRRRPALAPVGVWEPWDVGLSSPRDYACLVYLLWYARSPDMLAKVPSRQALFSEVVTYITDQADRLPGGLPPFDFGSRREDYQNLRNALRALRDLGAVVFCETEGANDEGEFTQALLEFTDVVESLVVELNPQGVDRFLENRPDPYGLDLPVLDETVPVPERVWRHLLLGPVFLRHDDPEAFDWLRRRRGEIGEEASRNFGYELETNRYYARFVRSEGSLWRGTSPLLSARRALMQAGLLLCSELRKAVRAGQWPAPDEDGCIVVDRARLETLFEQVYELYHEEWGSLGKRKPRWFFDSRDGLYPLLRQVGFLRGPDRAGRVLVLPTAGLYAVEYEQAESAPEEAPEEAADGTGK